MGARLTGILPLLVVRVHRSGRAVLSVASHRALREPERGHVNVPRCYFRVSIDTHTKQMRHIRIITAFNVRTSGAVRFAKLTTKHRHGFFFFFVASTASVTPLPLPLILFRLTAPGILHVALLPPSGHYTHNRRD